MLGLFPDSNQYYPLSSRNCKQMIQYVGLVLVFCIIPSFQFRPTNFNWFSFIWKIVERKLKISDESSMLCNLKLVPITVLL